MTLVVGKGGVGKTTIACALAMQAANAGRSMLVVSTDPAHSLADCVGTPVSDEPTTVTEQLSLLQVAPQRSFETFLRANRPALHAALDRGTYLDDDDIAALLDLPLPGIDEVTALIEIIRLLPDPRWQHIVVDTAPTGHTERLLQLPLAFHSFGLLLDALQERYRFMVARLAGGYRADDVDNLLRQLRDDADELQAMLHDASQTQVILVTRAEPVIEAETLRYLSWLRGEGLPVRAVIVNGWDTRCPVHTPLDPATLTRFEGLVAPVPFSVAPLLRRAVVGQARLRRFGDILAHGWQPPSRGGSGKQAPVVMSPIDLPFSRAPLQFVVGKGGVGKTTLASANALALAREGLQVLLVSLDPAHSVGDVWAAEVGDVPVEVAPGLWTQAVDAPARWDQLRRSWQSALREAADDGAGAGLPGWRETVADVEELLDLAPPGIDEVVGLFVLAGTADQGKFDAVVVDCAPTGHLLRLLALPELALSWVRMLMRLCLKYKEIIGLGRLAEELLALAKELKASQARMRDPGGCRFIPVAVPEAMVVDETQRLVDALLSAGTPVGPIILNKRRPLSCPRCRAAATREAGYAELLHERYGVPVVDVPLQAHPLVALEALATLSGLRDDVGEGDVQ